METKLESGQAKKQMEPMEAKELVALTNPLAEDTGTYENEMEDLWDKSQSECPKNLTKQVSDVRNRGYAQLTNV